MQDFDIKQLAQSIIEILPVEVQSDHILQQILAQLQKSIDSSKLVPQNFNRYLSQKKKASYINAIRKENFEKTFFMGLVKQIFPDQMTITIKL